MRDDIEILNVFKESVLVEIAGRVPQVRFKLHSPHLRAYFPGSSTCFYVLLSGCKGLQYFSFGEDKYLADFKAIAQLQPEFLDTIQFGDSAHINCTTGKLEIIFSEITIQLETGQAVSFKALQDAADEYKGQFDDPLMRL